MAVYIDSARDLNKRLQRAGNKLVVLNFFATWCGPCKMLAPNIEDLAIDLAGSVIILKVDVDECEDIAADYGVSSMPTFVFVKRGKKINSFSGANIDKLKRWISRNK